jgi:hypothetical protein
VTNLEYIEMDVLINAEIDAEEKEEARRGAEADEFSDYGRSPRNAYGLDREDVATLREWGVI